MVCTGKPALLFACLFVVMSMTSAAQSREEFNGPFRGWKDLKKDFGAKGNGKDDDTKAFQKALSGLSCPPVGYNIGNEGYMVIYVPAGAYCISSTLLLRGKIGVSIIGEDPVNTIIRWTGPEKDTCLWANGSAYFKIARLTWDANGRKDMEGIGVHWKDRWADATSRSFASLNIEISDCIFKGGKYGIFGGTYGGANGTGNNDSEITIRRCVFDHCTSSGVMIQGFNALDYWIWDCRFINCESGVWCAHGNFHVNRSYFTNSHCCDVRNDNGYYTSVRGCYSEGPRNLSLDDGISSNPFKRIFQDDILINPTGEAIDYFHTGKITLFGNQFMKSKDTFSYSVKMVSWYANNFEVLSLHNKYEYQRPINILSSPQKIYSFGDQIQAVIRPSAAAFLAGMDKTPAKVRRPVLEVPAGADADAIQRILDQAFRMKGQRPVVHFVMGTYTIDKSLVISAGADMQIVGDGLLYATYIRRKEGKYPYFRIDGPSFVTIRDLQLGSDGDRPESDGIVFRNVDQQRAEAHLDQLYSQADTSLYLKNLDYLYVQKDNSFFSTGNYISGGPQVRKGKGTARLYCFGGQFAGLTVQQNASFMAKDCWWEGSERVPLNISGSGMITIDGAMLAPANADSTPTVKVGKFDGSVTLMNMYVQGGLTVQPDNPALKVLFWNIHVYHKMDALGFVRNPTYKGAFAGFTAQCFDKSDACKVIIPIPDRFPNVGDVNAFFDSQTYQSREGRPLLTRQLPAGVSNIYISRVTLGKMKRGIVYE